MRLAELAAIALAAPIPTPAQPIEVTIVAHRGLAAGVPENTLAAFRQSIDRGVTTIETDLRLTKDGHLVVIHDETLDRTTNCAGRVSAIELARIKACDAGSGERVPMLAEVLELVGDKPVRLLADVKDPAALAPVLRAVSAHRAERQVIIGLRSTEHVSRARAALPGITILANMRAIADARAFAASRVHLIRLWSDWVEKDPGLIARTRSLGPDVWVMVGRRLPSKKRDWRALHGRMIAAGAQGLITDRPDLISAP